MTTTKHRNYKSFNSNYIGGWTFADGDKVLTIKDVMERNVANEKNQNGEVKMCVLFEEIDKPMVLNSTNNDTITRVIGSPNFDDWVGHKIKIGTEKVRAFGDVWDAVRVRDEKPKATQEPKVTEAQKIRILALVADDKVNLPAMLDFYGITNLDELTERDAARLIKKKGGTE
jgi:hypothetical protein